MKKPTSFDALVVYSEQLSASAENSPANVSKPFPLGGGHEDYNPVYEYFLEQCANQNLAVVFTTSADIIAPGTCASYWKFHNQAWKRLVQPGRSEVVLNKTAAVTPQLQAKCDLLVQGGDIASITSDRLAELFLDKQLTYDALRDFSIPTVSVQQADTAAIIQALADLQALILAHPHSEDFGSDVILKDQTGCGGIDIYKFSRDQVEEITHTVQKSKAASFVLQPFMNFDSGYTFAGEQVAADLRLVYIGTEIVQTYVRIAKAGDFRCNEHQGASLNYVSTEQMPPQVLELAQKVVEKLKPNGSLFSLDFVMSNNGNAYLLEGNSSPGLDWDLDRAENQREAQKLIRKVVTRMHRLVEEA